MISNGGCKCVRSALWNSTGCSFSSLPPCNRNRQFMLHAVQPLDEGAHALECPQFSAEAMVGGCVLQCLPQRLQLRFRKDHRPGPRRRIRRDWIEAAQRHARSTAWQCGG
jgi:hypothetical protein